MPITCVQCSDFRCATMEILVEHVTVRHGEKLEVANHQFETTREFLTWQVNIEKETTSWFVKYRKREGKQHTIDWFRCNRTGTYKPRGTAKRAIKQQGTSKINGYCTAHMKVTTSKCDGKVTVEGCLGHFGHPLKLGHLRIPDQIRQTIAGKLAKGVTIESVLDQIRNSTQDGISREHLIDRKDIINVKHQFNVDLMEKDSKDTRSIHYWVNELEKGEFNPVVVYKPPRDRRIFFAK
ncbi:PREDICTED: zinc finger transcription factor family protein 17-like [Priapulus caudatus]|uniref:Zinc finger transcription factor family protein 17-like n=1 Tax=Priapulus caudatus TaxID=37621 RepID=A0ABM1EWJ5_PRICU|nr:PREDICTED: zinc finger transcription factor family protein 17-like [Priapulus caudatus]